MSGAGDINGDGLDDLLIAATGESATYVIFGQRGFAAGLNLSTLDGANGFRINPVASSDALGSSVSGAGDVNADGFDDLVVGAIGANRAGAGSSGTGASYVIFGQGPAPLPFISIADAAAAEGNTGSGSLTFPVTLSAASTQTVTVQFSTVDETAAAGSDCTGVVNQTLQFAPGETSKVIAVTVNGDASFELDETFSVALSNPTNAQLGDSRGVGKVFNDDAPAMSINDVTVAEGASGTTAAVFTVSLSGPTTQPVTVQYATNDSSATAPEDYLALPLTTLSFAAGEQTKTVTVTTNGDLAIEPDETFTMNLSNPTNATVADARGSGVILNDDSAFAAVFELSSLDGSNGFKLNGVADFDFSGHSVSDAGDVNGDGFEDVIIGAFGADPNGSYSGASYVMFGKAGGFAKLDLASLDGSNGFKLSGVAELIVGGSVLNAEMLVGYRPDGTPFNPDAGIGSIEVGRNDALIVGDTTPGLFARIASVVIAGTATGSSGSTADHFGITAQQIGRIVAGSARPALNAGPNDALLDPVNADFRAVDFA